MTEIRCANRSAPRKPKSFQKKHHDEGPHNTSELVCSDFQSTSAHGNSPQSRNSLEPMRRNAVRIPSLRPALQHGSRRHRRLKPRYQTDVLQSSRDTIGDRAHSELLVRAQSPGSLRVPRLRPSGIPEKRGLGLKTIMLADDFTENTPNKTGRAVSHWLAQSITRQQKRLIFQPVDKTLSSGRKRTGHAAKTPQQSATRKKRVCSSAG